MITRFSWRSEDCLEVAPSSGTTEALAEQLLVTDGGSVNVLHLGPGGSTAREQEHAGQLVVVVAGSGMVAVGDEQVSVAAGDAVRWPAGVPHRLWTDAGISVLLVSHPESARSWRVHRTDATGRRWTVGVFHETDRARTYRDRLRARSDDETVSME